MSYSYGFPSPSHTTPEFLRLRDEQLKKRQEGTKIFVHEDAYNAVLELMSSLKEAMEAYKRGREQYEKKVTTHYKNLAKSLSTGMAASPLPSEKGRKPLALFARPQSPLEEAPDLSELQVRRGKTLRSLRASTNGTAASSTDA